MSGKGIVMEIASKHYIVLTPSGEFRRVPRTGQPDADLGDEIALMPRRRIQRRTAWTVASTAIVMLLLFPLVLVPNTNADPIVAYVTLDVNPSVEMGISDEEEVRELRGLNAEGEQVVDGLQYKGAKAADVAAAIVARVSQNASYSAGEDQDIVIASVVLEGETDNPERFEAELESEIRVAVAKQLADPDHVTMLSAPQEVREEAARQGVSTGKMAVYLLAKSKNPDVELDSLKTQSIHDWTEPVGGLKSVVPAKPAKPPVTASPKKTPTMPKNTAPDSVGKGDQKQRQKHAEERHKQEKEQLKALLEREKGSEASKEHKNSSGQPNNGTHNGGAENNGGKSNGPNGKSTNPTDNKVTGGNGQSSSGTRGESGNNGSKGGDGSWSNWNSWNFGNNGNKGSNGKDGNNDNSNKNGNSSSNSNNSNGGNSKTGGNSDNGSKNDNDQSDKNGNKSNNGKADSGQSNNGSSSNGSGSGSSNIGSDDNRSGSSGYGSSGSGNEQRGADKDRDHDDDRRGNDKEDGNKNNNDNKGKDKD